MTVDGFGVVRLSDGCGFTTASAFNLNWSRKLVNSGNLGGGFILLLSKLIDLFARKFIACLQFIIMIFPHHLAIRGGRQIDFYFIE